jgi:hypothetical protein
MVECLVRSDGTKEGGKRPSGWYDVDRTVRSRYGIGESVKGNQKCQVQVSVRFKDNVDSARLVIGPTAHSRYRPSLSTVRPDTVPIERSTTWHGPTEAANRPPAHDGPIRSFTRPDDSLTSLQCTSQTLPLFVNHPHVAPPPRAQSTRYLVAERQARGRARSTHLPPDGRKVGR